MKIIKLGGSVITDKKVFGKFRDDNMKKLAKVISENREKVILIHGAGSFGHLKALRYHLELPGNIEGKEKEISEVIGDVLSLNSKLVGILNDEGIRAISLPPHSIYPLSSSNFRIVRNLIDSGFVPVMYGDIILSKKEYRIISGDEIALDLAQEFSPETIIFVSDVDGLFTADPKIVPGAKLIRSIKSEEMNVKSLATDATGSMNGKMKMVKEMLKYSPKVLIVNGNYPERLGKYLMNKDTIGTVIT